MRHGFASTWLTLLTALLLLAAWVLAIVLAVRLHRWGWLVACVLLFVAVPVFAIAMLIDSRTTAGDRRQQASFEDAMAQALADEHAERSQGGSMNVGHAANKRVNLTQSAGSGHCNRRPARLRAVRWTDSTLERGNGPGLR